MLSKKSLALFLVLFFSLAHANAQSNLNSGEIYLKLRKLNVLGSVLYIAAHPDDENTRLLTYFSKDKLYRTGYLSITRGDGGQNLIGDEQGIELGLIRTQELLSARRIDGAEQFFTRAFDFGYSKTPAETFAKWDKEKILSDVVWVIRKFRPDVIITRFPTTGEGGHGHHTASAILAVEAFSAAADPKRFPEQLQYVQPWQATRILWNSFNQNNPTADVFKLDVGGYNPVLGKSYGEIAADSRSQHKSQGFGVARTRGEAFENFTTLGGKTPVTDLFDDVNTGWKKIPGGDKVASSINSIIGQFDFLAPEKSLPEIVNLYKTFSAMPAGYWRDQKLKEMEKLIEELSGIWAEVFTQQATGTVGDSVRISVSVNNRVGADIKLNQVSFAEFDSIFNLLLQKNKNINWSKTLLIPNDHPVTQPFWLEQSMSEGYYEIEDQLLIGEADVQPALTANMHFTVNGVPVVFKKPIRYKTVDPVRGELYQPFAVLPEITVNDFQQFHFSSDKKTPVVVLTAQKDVNVPVPKFIPPRIVPDDSIVRPQDYHINGFALKKGASKEFEIDEKKPGYYQLRILGDMEIFYPEILRTIKYDHIPWQYYFKSPRFTIKDLNIQTRGKRIGYITGAGDKVPEALEAMGYEVTMLGEKELSRNNLKSFDAIISGVRAYNTNEWLNKYHTKLMKYVEEGGNLIVQYNTSNNIGPVRAKIGPYNFNISRNRITDENAAVTFLKPDHVLLNYPNKITQEDFKGWIQERSIYHAADFDSNFETVFAMSDPGEQPDSASLITAKYGKGFFTYTGIVFFRELPAGVTGAYRLMANLIALNQKKEL